MCLRQAKGVSIEGYPRADFNGVYTHDSTHEGWPVLKNASGMYCYRHTPMEKWLLNNKLTPDSDLCNANIVAKEGPLPVGARTWQCWINELVEWQERTLTVTLQ